MSQALSEFRSPVGQEALRLRMVAMHGREDPLLDAARFPRLLRQANDAEVADVRKVGDDDYEIAAQRGAVRQPTAPIADEAQSGASASADNATPDSAAAPARDNGQRFGVRFRRGSRAPMRPGEIPLIGVVKDEPAATPAVPDHTAAIAEVPAEVSEAPKRARPRRPPRKRAAAPAEAGLPDGSQAADAETPSTESPPVRRPRARSRKKPE